MELNLKKEAVAACELLLDSAAEQTIECDVLLPDYCPDIVRVLCCGIDAAVSDCRTNKTTFTIEGTANVEICYMADVGGVRRTCYSIPFSKSFEMRAQPQKPIWSVNVRQGHTNCRAASKRRLDIRGAIVVSAKVYETAGESAVVDAEGSGIQLCRSEKNAVEIIRQLQRQMTFAEAVIVPPGKAMPVEIVAVRCSPFVSEIRVMASRILLKGELAVHMLYKTDPDAGMMETADYNLPISQVFDDDGLSDDMRCTAWLKCISAECSADDFSDDGQLRLEARLMADIRLYRPIRLVGAIDSFSTLYPTENSVADLKIPTDIYPVMQREAVKHSAGAPQGIMDIIDVKADILEYAAENSGENTDISAKVKFTAIISTEDTAADTFIAICDARTMLPIRGRNCELLITPVTSNAYSRLMGDQIEFGCDMTVSGTAIEWENQQLITDLAVDQTVNKSSDPSLGLIVYYAEAGERVWDIAKRFGSLPQKIIEDNGLKADIIETDMPVMIPTV